MRQFRRHVDGFAREAAISEHLSPKIATPCESNHLRARDHRRHLQKFAPENSGTSASGGHELAAGHSGVERQGIACQAPPRRSHCR